MDNFQFPQTRRGLTRKIQCGPDVYLTVNAKPNGELGEVFVRIAKQGSTVSGLMQAWVITISAALQRGVAWSELREKFVGTTFEPRTAKYSSLVDAVSRNIDEMIDELRRQSSKMTGQKELDFQQES